MHLLAPGFFLLAGIALIAIGNFGGDQDYEVFGTFVSVISGALLLYEYYHLRKKE